MSLTIGTSEKQRRRNHNSTKRAGGDDEAPAMGITITDTDFQRLKELIKRYRASWRTYGPYLNAVERELERARIVAASAVDANVITINSRVKLRDLSTDETF